MLARRLLTLVLSERVWIWLAGMALVASLVATAGLTDEARSSLLLAFGAVVALGLTRHAR
jgi:hypothetical protein